MKLFYKIAVLFYLFGSCQPPETPYAVMIWAQEGSVLTDGSVFSIKERRQSPKGTELHLLPETGDGEWVEEWRVLEFPSKTQAMASLPLILEKRSTLALGSRLWFQPDPYSEIVLVLGKGKNIRILSQQVQGEGRTVSWAYVLTDEGIKGWIPMYMLTEGLPEFRVRTLTQLIEKGPWKPSSFLEMIKTERVSLKAFQNDLGLSLIPEEGRLTITLMEGGSPVREDFRFTSFSEKEQAEGVFYGEGVIPLRIQWKEENKILLFLPGGDSDRILEFVSFSGTLGERDQLTEAVSRELAERSILLDSLSLMSRRWSSAAYGSLEIKKNGDFSWEGPDRLLPYLTQIIFPTLAIGEVTPQFPDSVSPWFGADKHGGYLELTDGESLYAWEGRVSFDIFTPLPKNTKTIGIHSSGVTRGLLFQLKNADAAGLPFAVGIEKTADRVLGLILVPLSPLLFGTEGAYSETLPEKPITLYFEPELDG